MIVLRRWPTCIGLATLGELKSMTNVCGDWARLDAQALSRGHFAAIELASQSGAQRNIDEARARRPGLFR